MIRREVSKRRTAGVSVGRTPPGPLTDGRVTVRLPSRADVPRAARYGGDEQLLEGIWIAGPPPGPDLDAWASDAVSEALAGWTADGGVHGGGLVIDEEEPFVGILYLSPRGDDALDVAYGVAPPFRGRGIATRALGLVAEWALAHAAFARVELRIAQGHAESRRVAEKAGFHLEQRFEVTVEATGETYTDLLYSRGR